MSLRRDSELEIYRLIKRILKTNSSYLFSHQQTVSWGFGSYVTVYIRDGYGHLRSQDFQLIYTISQRMGIEFQKQVGDTNTYLEIHMPIQDAFTWLQEVWNHLSDLLTSQTRLVGYVGSDGYVYKIDCSTTFPPKRSSYLSPDLCFVIPQVEMIFDKQVKTLKIVNRYKNIQDTELKNLFQRYMGVSFYEKPEEKVDICDMSWEEMTRNVTIVPSDLNYLHMIEVVKKEIKQQNLVKVVIARQAHGTLHGTAEELFKMLRLCSPTHYEFLFEMEDFQLVGCSPEMLVEIKDSNQIRFRVLAGTGLLKEQIQEDPKQVVEHLTTFLGAVKMMTHCCEPSTVCVKQVLGIEPFAQIQHFASELVGRSVRGIVPTWSFFLPTLTGTPGVEAFHTLSRFEPFSRGVYGGIFGYFDASESLFCKIIRSVYLEQDQFYTFSGAGIIPESLPENELIETHNKMRSCLYAIAKVNAQKKERV